MLTASSNDGGSNKHYKLKPKAMFTILKIIMNLSSFLSLFLLFSFLLLPFKQRFFFLFCLKPTPAVQHFSKKMKKSYRVTCWHHKMFKFIFKVLVPWKFRGKSSKISFSLHGSFLLKNKLFFPEMNFTSHPLLCVWSGIILLRQQLNFKSTQFILYFSFCSYNFSFFFFACFHAHSTRLLLPPLCA